MMLGLSKRLLDKWAEINIFNISSFGIDVCLLPHLISKNNFNPPTVIHAGIAKHCKPVETNDRVFSNHKTGEMEFQELQDLIDEI